MFDEWPDGRERGWTPAIDVVREHEHLVVRADPPGIKPEEVKIEVEDDILTISGEHEERTKVKDEPYLRRERRYGCCSRSMALPGASMPTRSRRRPATASSR
jgi:HSP20 family protein